MNDRAAADEAKGKLLVGRIIWFAVLSSTWIYLLVIALLEQEPSNAWESFLFPLAIAAGALTVAAVVVPKWLGKSSQGRSSDSFLVVVIVGLAIADAVAILGFWIGFQGAPTMAALPFFGVAWALMAIQFPTQAKVEKYS